MVISTVGLSPLKMIPLRFGFIASLCLSGLSSCSSLKIASYSILLAQIFISIRFVHMIYILGAVSKDPVLLWLNYGAGASSLTRTAVRERTVYDKRHIAGESHRRWSSSSRQPIQLDAKSLGDLLGAAQGTPLKSRSENVPHYSEGEEFGGGDHVSMDIDACSPYLACFSKHPHIGGKWLHDDRLLEPGYHVRPLRSCLDPRLLIARDDYSFDV